MALGHYKLFFFNKTCMAVAHFASAVCSFACRSVSFFGLPGFEVMAYDAHHFYRIKYFTNGRLRIDFFQPTSLLVANDAIMGDFDKPLIIKCL